MPKQALVTVEQMSIRLGGVEVVSDLDFSVHHNEILGVVGESGSGKSVTAMSLMGLLPNQGESLRASRMDFAGQSLIPFDEKQFQALRGKQMGMVFQDPMSALNPSIRCGKQVLEMLDLHSPQSKKDQQAFMLSLLNKVKLPDPKSIANRYPHQLSGGQQQRVLIAIAIACNPKLLIADEPTTALDPEVQEEIMALLKSIQLQSKMSIVLISHDLNLVQRWADRVLVLNKGVCEEAGTAKQLFQRPQSPYTKGLINAVPPVDRRPKRLQTVQDFINGGVKHPNETTRERKKRHKRIYQQPPILEVKGLEKIFRQGKQSHRVLDEIDFSLYPGETLGLVGSSGSGKSTLGNCLLKLTHPDRGEIYYSGTKINTLKGEVLRKYRKDVQLIFQDPFSSLNPKQKVEKILTEPMLVHNIGANKAERIDRAVQLLKQVGLEAAHMNAYPHMFSGGQRQRIGIARALAVEPKLVVCDESVSALDRSVQAQVLNLLNELKETYDLTYLFIAHDLEVVRYLSDRILHLQNGNIMILDEADIVYQQIRDHQTQETS
ncbi:MAG: ABC transporter ATP-binding protein [Flavobacteriaceae bacterium]|nr:ABC transporter ATP-binding protein [Flavobacteriaceae bacterium]|tara:strand:- start:488 stop:2128 length:1641 start_codon:yes stop_codon:yes gene_type:complete